MNFASSFDIGPYSVGNNEPVFIIAEAGVNHNGSIENAYKLVDIAYESGATAVKFQLFKTSGLILKQVEKAEYQKLSTNNTQSQYEMLKSLELGLEAHLKLKEYSESKGLVFLTTPFDFDSLNDLDELGLYALKISSSDLTNIPFLRAAAKKGIPLIISTGMSYMSEVEEALRAIHPWNPNLVLMHCTANYPADDTEINLNVLHTFKDTFDVILGYSDHSTGVGASPYAVCLGAKVVEKHFTLDKTLPGPDHRASLDPWELKAYVQAIRAAETYLGSSIKEPTPSELKNRASMQKCLVATQEIKQGELFTADNIMPKRTGGEGISASQYDKIIGQKASQHYQKHEII